MGWSGCEGEVPRSLGVIEDVRKGIRGARSGRWRRVVQNILLVVCGGCEEMRPEEELNDVSKLI